MSYKRTHTHGCIYTACAYVWAHASNVHIHIYYGYVYLHAVRVSTECIPYCRPYQHITKSWQLWVSGASHPHIWPVDGSKVDGRKNEPCEEI